MALTKIGTIGIDDNAVTTTQIAATTIVNADISGSAAIAQSKLAAIASDALSGNMIDGGTISNFASTGIDDNADAVAITITSAEKVGLGVTDPDEVLEVNGAIHSGNRIDIYKGGNVTKSGTMGANDDIGLTGMNASDFVIKTTEATSAFGIATSGASDVDLYIADSGNVGIGVTDPDQTLEVNGQIKVTGGTPGAGKVLASDADGVGSWSGVSQPNLLINGGFDVWQRGVSFASASYYQWYADRWNGDAFNSANFTVTKQTATTAEPFLSYLRFLRNSSSTDTSKGRIGQVYESEDSQGLAGQTVTLSFYARVGANWSPATNVLVSGIFIGTGTNQSTSNGLGSAWTGFVIQNQNNTMTTSWVRFTHTVTLSAVTNQIGIQFTAPASVGTAGAADSWDISGVKLEVGSVATPYVATPYEETIARCQRYYQKSYNINVNPGTGSSVGSCSSLAIYSTGSQSLGARWITTMRAAPTVVIYANDGTSGNVTATSNNANIAATAGDVGDSGFQYLSGSLPNTFPNGVRFHWTAASEL